MTKKIIMSFHGGSNRYLDENIPVFFLKKKKKKVSQHGIVVSISRCQEILRNLEIKGIIHINKGPLQRTYSEHHSSGLKFRNI